ncbi:MAG: membrane protein insertion efficiency factor YidD [Armatimonadetes bacterium]|nr:membrane protein insertion efficiency factor YidD [Armatimonadota bacterium]MDW8028793.1 membrane protein insertion efficiency factor YidD [Armatimonadota bacterium]
MLLKLIWFPLHLLTNFLTRLALLILRFYKRFISPLLPPTCRFTPTCSEYAMQAIERFGFWRGSWLAIKRLFRCHPLNPGGYDPVPESWHSSKTSKVCLPLLLALSLMLTAFAVASDWTSATMTKLLTPPKTVEQAAKEWTEIQGQLQLFQDKRDESFARLKFREAIVLVALKREEEAHKALDEVVHAYEQNLRQKEQVNLQTFKELAIAAAYQKAKLIAKRDGQNHRNTVKALERVESLLHSGSTFGVYGTPVQDSTLWVWDEKDREVKRYDSAYEVVSNELEEIYRTGLNYQLFDALVNLCGRNPSYSHGLAVILLALLLRILMHPLNRKAMKSMWKMQALQPLLQDLQERYRDDPQRLNAEIWKLYREHGVSPFGGCLPLLLQLPVLFWVYYGVLHYRFQFAKARFLWVENLAMPDYPLFALYLVTFFASTFFMSTPTQDPTQKQQQLLMNIMFVVMFAVFFHSFPAAFILYWLSFQVFYIGESLLMKKVYYREMLPVREVTATGEEKPKRGQRRKAKTS